MLDGGGRCKVSWSGLVRWRGGEVGMEWWHYLETESFYRNISGSSVTRPHCAHRHQLGHTPPSPLTREPRARSAFPRRKRIKNASIYLCQASFLRYLLTDVIFTVYTQFPFYPKLKIGIGSGNRKTESLVLD